MDFRLEGLRRGWFRHTSKPGLIRVVTLDYYLQCSLPRAVLIRELVYFLSTTLTERLRERDTYQIAYRSGSLLLNDWSLVLVLSTTRSKISLEDMLVVDLVHLEEDRDRLFSEYPWFKESLLIGLQDPKY